MIHGLFLLAVILEKRNDAGHFVLGKEMDRIECEQPDILRSKIFDLASQLKSAAQGGGDRA